MTFAGARALVNRLMSGMWSTMEIIRESSGINWLWLWTLFKGTPFYPLDIIGHHSEGGGGKGGWMAGASGVSCSSTKFGKTGKISKITLTGTHLAVGKHHHMFMSVVDYLSLIKHYWCDFNGGIFIVYHVCRYFLFSVWGDFKLGLKI